MRRRGARRRRVEVVPGPRRVGRQYGFSGSERRLHAVLARECRGRAALRIALSELVLWIDKDYGLHRMDAYALLSQVARIHLTEMVDPNYVVIAIMDKKYLPPKK